MMTCQNKLIVLGLVGLFSSQAHFAYAQLQSAPDDVVEPAIEPVSQFQESTPLQERESATPYFGAPSVPTIDRDQATGNALVITPGPYLTPGTVQADPFRGQPIQSFYEDENIFVIQELDTSTDIEVLPSQDPYSFDVVAGQLEEIDPASLGLLEERSGGLSYSMWSGSSYERVLNILSRLPVATPSFTINSLSELVLLSSAEVPSRSNKGFDVLQIEENNEENNNEFLLARLMRLSQTGKMNVVADFMNALPQDVNLPELRELRINTALLSNNTLHACNMAQDARAIEGATYWLKVLTYCRAVEGDRAGVDFNVSLLQETGEAPIFFVNLVEDILNLSEGSSRSGGGAQTIDPSQMNALNIAMLNTARAELPLYVLAEMPRLFLSSITRRADLSIDFRAEVSELAALYGVMEGRVFSEVLAAMDFTDGERDSIFLLANTDLGARVDGLLINSAMVENDRLRKAELISTAFERGMREKLYPALSRPLLDVVKTMSPSPDLAFFAHDAGRIALYSGDGATAQRWYNLVLGLSSEANFEANRSLLSLWPLMVMHDQTRAIPVTQEIISLWQKTLSQLPAEVQQQRVSLLYALLDVFEYEVPEMAWDGAFSVTTDAGEAAMPPHAIWRSFLLAARAGRVGETLSLGLMVLGDAGVGEVNTSVLTSVLSILRTMGLEDEARALAMEALVAGGF